MSKKKDKIKVLEVLTVIIGGVALIFILTLRDYLSKHEVSALIYIIIAIMLILSCIQLFLLGKKDKYSKRNWQWIILVMISLAMIFIIYLLLQ